MKRKILFLIFVVLIISLPVWLWQTSKSQGGETIKISSAPYTIYKEGYYELNNDISTQDPNDNAITIAADNVFLDLKSYKISGLNDPYGDGSGVFSTDHKNITVINGKITGFAYGVWIDQASLLADRPVNPEVSVEKLTLDKNSYRGIKVLANRAEIRDADISNTGGYQKLPNSAAIEIGGYNCRAQSNQISNLLPVGINEGIGITVTNPYKNCQISDNTVEQSVAPEYGRVFGFWVNQLPNSGQYVQVKNNTIRKTTYAYWYSGLDEVDRISKFSNNTLDSIDCSRKDLPDYYVSNPLIESNNWINETDGCSDSEDNFLEKSEQGDPRAQYRLADIYYHNIKNFLKSEAPEEKKLRLQKAYDLYSKAAENLSGMEKDVAEGYRDGLATQLGINVN